MANVLINDKYLENIADAIREKSGTVLTYKPKEMANAIAAIPSGGYSGIDNMSKQLIERTLEGTIALDVDEVGAYALAGLPRMTSLTCTAKRVQDYGCYGNDELTTVNFPEVYYLGQNAFGYNDKLNAVNIPRVEYIGRGAFNRCVALWKLDLGSHLKTLRGGIADGSALDAIIIRTNYVPDCTEQINPFLPRFSSKVSSASYIYVPKDMIAAYQGYEGQPSNMKYDYWSMQNYRAIEDYPEICG